ncbi:MAG: UDP-N-acetylmuramoyl-L-alanine--D-glutamate ligase [Saprospiraceae bacterium]|nr:UDP-N-acetylmuramoyl-L-alanine--D-glutamate ligase [Saprospiraceae bacterium]
MVLILGAGESGVGAALLARKMGLSVFVSEKGLIRSQFKEELILNQIDFEEGSHEIAEQLQPDLLVKSPGIPDEAEILTHFKSKDIPSISEIEFAYPYCKGIIIGITGSNGKTTTTNLAYHLLHENGIKVCKCGNVGLSFARAVALGGYDYYVLELSSFQLDGIEKFTPTIAILLNITPDHLDRYGYKMERYIASKFRIAMNQKPEHTFIVFEGDRYIMQYLAEHPVQSEMVFVKPELSNSGIIYSDGKKIADTNTTKLKGRHNAINMTCATEVALRCGLTSVQIQNALNTFVNDPHRLESIGEINGVEFINDSKATNVDSVFWALDAMQKPVIWIAGGQDKGNEYQVLVPLISKKVKALIAMGVDNSKILKSFDGIVQEIRDTNSMADAMEAAMNIAQAGDVVLLSPACASFDLFKNYEDRGNQFKETFRIFKLNTI